MTQELEHLTAQVAALSAQVETLQKRLESVETRDSISVRSLTICDEEGQTRAQFFHEEGETRLIFMNRRGIACELRATMGDADTPGEAELLFPATNASEFSDAAVRLGLSDGHGALEILTRDAIPAALVKATDAGGAISIVDETGKVRVLLRNEEDGGIFEIFGPNFGRCAMLRALPDGGLLGLSPQGGHPLFVAAGTQSGAMLSLHDPDATNDTGQVRLATNGQIALLQVLGPGEDTPGVSITATQSQASLDLNGDADAKFLSLAAESHRGSFSINDGEGKQRIALEMVENNAMLTLKSPDGDAQMMAMCNEKPMLGLTGGSGDHRILLSADEKDARLCIYDNASTGTNENGELPRILLSTTDGNGQLHLFGEGGSNSAAILRGNPEGGSLILTDGAELPRAVIWNDDEGAIFELHGADGTRRLGLMARDAGGQIAAMSDLGTPRVAIGVAGDHGQIAVSASGGDVVAAISAGDEGGTLILADGDGIAKLELPDDASLL